jgi:NADPH-dependent curcumin reductase CurA
MEGFLVFDFRERYGEALERMAGWIKEGKLKWAETVVGGVERAPEAFIGMMRGENVGKMVVKVR